MEQQLGDLRASKGGTDWNGSGTDETENILAAAEIKMEGKRSYLEKDSG